MTQVLDFSQFKKNFVRDSDEDIKDILAMKQMARQIEEGRHEVTVCGIHEKDGVKFKMTDKAGGAMGFSIVVRNAQKHEQMIYVSVPLMYSYKQVLAGDFDKGVKFLFRKSFDILQAMQINAGAFREAVIASEGKALDMLVGAQLVVVNSWDSRSIHLEYDSTAKAHYFVTAMGERFQSGVMSVPLSVDTKLPIDKRYLDFIAIAHDENYKLATKMDTVVEPHPTASNEEICKKFDAYGKKEEPKKPLIVNKTIPAFPTQIKRPVVPVDVEPDQED